MKLLNVEVNPVAGQVIVWVSGAAITVDTSGGEDYLVAVNRDNLIGPTETIPKALPAKAKVKK